MRAVNFMQILGRGAALLFFKSSLSMQTDLLIGELCRCSSVRATDDDYLRNPKQAAIYDSLTHVKRRVFSLYLLAYIYLKVFGYIASIFSTTKITLFYLYFL
ncbi:hypothetical protein ACJX0J_038345, partial [Zea mays]